ncbi:MAG: PAS domain S-box protein, partial [Gallionellaceae bacterium]
MNNHDISHIAKTSTYSTTKFPLLRHLSLVSLVAILVTATILVFLYRQDQLVVYAKIATEENQRTLFHLTDSLDKQLDAFIISASKKGAKPVLANSDLDSLLASALEVIHEEDILKLKIYSLSGTAIYSSAKSEIGRSSHHQDFVERALHGETVHSVEHRDSFLSMNGEMQNVELAITYKPLLHEGKRIGVIEIYDDATPVFKRLRANTINIILIVLGIFCMMFAALFFAIFRTDRAVAEWQKAVSESEESLSEAERIAGLGSFVIDIPSGSWKSSAMNDRIFGINDAYDCSAQGFRALLHPDERTMVDECFRKDALSEANVFDKAFRIIRNDDQAERWVHCIGKLKLDSSGRPLAMLCTTQDITESKQNEQALLANESKLREQKELLNSVIENALDAVVQVNMNGIITAWNKQAEQIFGWSDAEALGKVMHEMIVPEHYRDGHIQGVLHFFASGEGPVLNKRIEISALHRDGREFPIELSISANKIANGYEFSSFIRDISERKEAELLLLRHKQIIEAAMDGFWLMDENGYLLDANEAYAVISGYTIDELVGMHIRQLDTTDQSEDVA